MLLELHLIYVILKNKNALVYMLISSFFREVRMIANENGDGGEDDATYIANEDGDEGDDDATFASEYCEDEIMSCGCEDDATYIVKGSRCRLEGVNSRT
jgi:hypothetical protein